MSAVLLLTWMIAGVAISSWFAPSPHQRWSAAPLAVFLGPLWLFVALEQRASTPPPTPVLAVDAPSGPSGDEPVGAGSLRSARMRADLVGGGMR